MIPSTFDQPLLICFTDTDEIMEAVLNGRFLPLAWENARAQRIFTLFYSLLWDQIHHITSISIHIHQNIINHFGRGSYLTNENIWHHDNSRCPWCPCPWGDRFRRLKVQIDPKLHVEAVKVGRIVGLGMWWWNGYGGLEDVFFFFDFESSKDEHSRWMLPATSWGYWMFQAAWGWAVSMSSDFRLLTAWDVVPTFCRLVHLFFSEWGKLQELSQAYFGWTRSRNNRCI